MAEKLNSYDLSRSWFDWCFENPEKINPNHSAMYFFIIEQCNRLGWKEKFGLPMEMTKEAIGIKNYRTYKKTFDDLIEWNFIKLIEKSKNQFSSCIIAIVKNTKASTKASTKALDKAMIKHLQKQGQSIVCIDKQETINKETKKQIYRTFAHLTLTEEEFFELNKYYEKEIIDSILDAIENYKKNNNYKSLFLTAKKWLKSDSDKRKKEVPGGGGFARKVGAVEQAFINQKYMEEKYGTRNS